MTDVQLDCIKTWFTQYLDSLEQSDPDLNTVAVELKKAHSFQVAQEIATLAATLSLSGTEVAIAELLGLLHDVGRFEQIANHNTFNDGHSVNHAELGVTVLERHHVLDTVDPRYRCAMYCAIANHNRATLPPDLGTTEALYAKMIRDADKLDIYRITTAYFRQPVPDRNIGVELGLPDSNDISPEVFDGVCSGAPVSYAKMKTTADFKAVQLGWVHDIYFTHTLQTIADRGYLAMIRDSLGGSDQASKLYDVVMRYVGVRIGG